MFSIRATRLEQLVPKHSNLYKTVREHFMRGENQEVIDLAELATTSLPVGVVHYVAAALINLGNYAAAREHIEAALKTAEGADKANLIALDGFIEAHRGDMDGYAQRAREAVEVCATATTLYHLGIATASAGVEVAARLLQASLVAAEAENDPYAEARTALALSRNRLDAGAYKDALSWARFAHIRATHPGMRLVSFNYVAFPRVLVDDTELLEGELEEMVELGSV